MNYSEGGNIYLKQKVVFDPKIQLFRRAQNKNNQKQTN